MLVLVDKTKAIGLQTYFLFSVTKIARQRSLDKSIKETIQNYSGLIVELKSLFKMLLKQGFL